eukprot:TRINITY_DN3648_c0_g1_i1.p1 TRINITY_DN3648_c0_g1~~TRINITY_DN3648_c0_g1_i1.p1  ORF type:complete len:930 (+),score=207.80 TRINITY_DN3648_c0_g1_i1:328-3117(+)
MSGKPHDFAVHTFHSPTFCSHCNRFIWGLVKQGYQCKNCGQIAHKECLDKLPSNDCGAGSSATKRRNTRPSTPQLSVVSNSDEQHQFVKHHFSRPTWCKNCEEFIWGLGKQGYRCEKCHVAVHKKCLPKIKVVCSLVPKKEKQRSATVTGSSHSKDSKDERRNSGRVEEVKLPPPATHATPVASQPAKTPAPAPTPTPAPAPAPTPAKAPAPAALAPAPINQNRSSLSNSRSLQDCFEELKQRDIKQLFKFGQELGRGAFSVVYSGVDNQTRRQVAIKCIDRNMQKDDPDELDPLEALRREIIIMSQIDHPNVVRFYKAYADDRNFYLILELMPFAEELFKRIVNKGSYLESDAQKIAKQIFSAVDYLHSNGIAHRDLKPENILCSGDDENEVVKVTDFGLSKIFKEDDLQTSVGSPAYAAPEIFSNVRSYDKSVDMWSLGVIVFVLLSGEPPFYGASIHELVTRIMQVRYDFDSPIWMMVSPEAKDLIRKLLVKDPSKRYTTQQALAHPWLRNVVVNAKILNVGITLENKFKISKDSIEVFKTNIENHYTVTGEIARGTYSIVLSGVSKDNNEKVAIRCLEEGQYDDKKIQTLQREVAIMKKMDHPNIIRLFDIYVDKPKVYMVMEFVPSCDDLTVRIGEVDHYSEGAGLNIARQIISAVEYLHRNGVAHRDLKSDNILISGPPGEEIVKITGFGLSKDFQDDKFSTMQFTSPTYAAPELFLDAPYDKAIDMWALGVILYEIFAGYPPFFGESISELTKRIINVEYDFDDEVWDEVSEEGKGLISGLLQKDPSKRLTADQCMNAAWTKRATITDGQVILKSMLRQTDSREFSKQMKKAWEHYDKNGDGILSISESLGFLKDSLCLIANVELAEGITTTKSLITSESECKLALEQLLKDIDTEHKGEVTWAQFEAFLNNKAQALKLQHS